MGTFSFAFVRWSCDFPIRLRRVGWRRRPHRVFWLVVRSCYFAMLLASFLRMSEKLWSSGLGSDDAHEDVQGRALAHRCQHAMESKAWPHVMLLSRLARNWQRTMSSYRLRCCGRIWSTLKQAGAVTAYGKGCSSCRFSRAHRCLGQACSTIFRWFGLQEKALQVPYARDLWNQSLYGQLQLGHPTIFCAMVMFHPDGALSIWSCYSSMEWIQAGKSPIYRYYTRPESLMIVSRRLAPVMDRLFAAVFVKRSSWWRKDPFFTVCDWASCF